MGLTLRDFVLQHPDFAIEYISLHYPFTEAQVIEYMPYLIKGSAFYSEVVPELGTIIAPTIGLSFNQNIHWTPKLKRLWKVGYEIANPECRSESGGYHDHKTGQNIVWGTADAETLFDIIPLDIYKEQADNYYLHAVALDWEVSFDDVKPHDFSNLTTQELAYLYDQFPQQVLYNDSIWQNTLKAIFTPEFVAGLVQTKRHQKEREIADLEKELEKLGLSFDFGIDEPRALPQSYNPNIPLSEELKRMLRQIGFTDKELEPGDG